MSRPAGAGQRGFTLVDVAMAAAILGGALLVTLALVRQSYRQSMLGTRRDIARAMAANVLSVLAAVPFSALDEQFGPQGPYRTQPGLSPLLEGVPTGPELEGSRVEVAFRRSPASPGYGHIQVRVDIPDGRSRATVVVGRGLGDPSRTSRVNTGGGVNPDSLVQRAFDALGTPSVAGPLGSGTGRRDVDGRAAMSERNRQALTAFLEAMPHDPVAKLLMRAASADAADGKLDFDWSRLAMPPGDGRRWGRILAGMGLGPIPDGLYAVTWETVSTGRALLTPTGRRATFTIYTLRGADGREHFLLRVDEDEGGATRTTLGAEPALDLGARPIALVATGAGWVRPAEPREAWALLTRRRVLVVRDRFEPTGDVVPFDARMLVATLPEALVSLEVGPAASDAFSYGSVLAGLEAGR